MAGGYLSRLTNRFLVNKTNVYLKWNSFIFMSSRFMVLYQQIVTYLSFGNDELPVIIFLNRIDNSIYHPYFLQIKFDRDWTKPGESIFKTR